jgi:putative hydrolase of the HAD superfamily
VIELLEGLKAAGRGVYLLSNAQESFTIPEMDELGILKYFDCIMISSEEKVCKPQKQFFTKLLERYRLDPKECLMVGNDKNSDMRGAKAVGIDGLYIHQEISPEVKDESEIDAKWKIMDGDIRKILPIILEA